MSSYHQGVLLLLAFAASTAGLEAQVPFLRGDVNDDGRVSLDDAHAIALWQYGHGPEPACVKAADANDDGTVSAAAWRNGLSVDNDVSAILHDTVAGPSGSPGDDPTPDGLACGAYAGIAPPASDPAARLEILDATCPGGMDALAVLKVRVSHSLPIGGFGGVFDAIGIFAEAMWTIEVDGTEIQGIGRRHATLQGDGTVRFAHLEEYSGRLGSIAPAADHVVMKIYLRLAPFTRAGEYPIVLLEAEMADSSTGRAILPALRDGVLRVEEDVSPAAEAVLGRAGHWECEAGEPFAPAGPEDLQASFSLALIPGEPGSTVSMPVWIEANVPVEGFTFAITLGGDGVEGRFRVEGVVPVLREGAAWEAFEYETPDSRFVRGQAVFSRQDPLAFLEPGHLHHVLDIEISIDAALQDGQVHTIDTSFRDFVSVPERPEISGETAVIAFGQLLRKRRVTCLEVSHRPWGIVIGQDPRAFLRGDANADGAISLGDAVQIAHLFRRGSKLPCDDAGDANDDGGRNVGDAVRILEHLYDPSSPETDIPAPATEPGTDESLDPLPCEEYRTVPAPRTNDLLRFGSVEAAPGGLIEVPIFATTSLPLEALVVVARYDPLWLAPVDRLREALRLDGGILDAYRGAEGAFFNVLRTDLVPGHAVIVLALDIFRPPTALPAEDALVGRFLAQVSPNLQPEAELTIQPVAFAANDPTRPDRLRTEIVVDENGKPVTRLPTLQAGVIRILDPDEPTFIRGDANGDLTVNISDPIFTLAYLFLGGPGPVCEDAVDADDSGRLELTDAVFTLGFLFGGDGARPLPPPYPESGRDGEPDALAPCREAPR